MKIDKRTAQYYLFKVYTAGPDKYNKNTKNGPLYSSEDLRIARLYLVLTEGKGAKEKDKVVTILLTHSAEQEGGPFSVLTADALKNKLSLKSVTEPNTCPIIFSATGKIKREMNEPHVALKIYVDTMHGMKLREAPLVERNEFKNRTHKLIRDAGDAYIQGDASFPTIPTAPAGADAKEVEAIYSKLLDSMGEQLAETQVLLAESRKDAIDISIQSRKEVAAIAGETQELAKTTVRESNDTARSTVKESNRTARDSIAALTHAGAAASLSTPPPRKHRGGVDSSTLSRLKNKVVRMENELNETKVSLFKAIELFGEERDRAQHFEEQLGKANNDAENLAKLCQRLTGELDDLDLDTELLREQAEMDRDAIEETNNAKERLKEMLGQSGRHVEALKAELKVAFDMMYDLRPSF